jgi:DNA-binding CsgD family transcriptional regulator/PAS domain-containing protein
MGKVESIRLASIAVDRELPITAAGRHGSELLDILATGEPPAFATDSRERVVFWNHGAAALLGMRAEEAMGRHCYEVMGGRDVFDNRFCYANCPLAAMSRGGEVPRPFEIRVPAGDERKPATVHVTVVRLPGPRPDLFTLVHILHGVDETARLARALPLVPRTDVQEPMALGRAAAEPAVAGDGKGPTSLTPREREILTWMAAGLQNKEIAGRLKLSLATVRNHIHNTLEKLGVHSKLEAVSLAYRNGWVTRSAAPTRQG